MPFIVPQLALPPTGTFCNFYAIENFQYQAATDYQKYQNKK